MSEGCTLGLILNLFKHIENTKKFSSDNKQLHRLEVELQEAVERDTVTNAVAMVFVYFLLCPQ